MNFMSQIDDYYRNGGIPNTDISQVPLVGGDVISDIDVPLGSDQAENIIDDPSSDRHNFLSWLDNYIESLSVTGLTSRDQIINPEKILEGFSWSNSDEDIALYNRYLGLLRNIQAQQEASFQEWYNSTTQQAIRDREAGLNTDILGISGQSMASGASVQSDSPFDGVVSQETRNYEQQSIRLQKFQSVMAAVSSICNIPASFASAFGAVGQGASAIQALQGQKLANIENFEKLAGSEISARLTDAISASLASGKSLDIAEWFGNDANFEGILSTYAPDSSQAYIGSFANLRSRMQRSLGSAYGEGKVTADNQGSFSALLADPRYSSDQLVQIAHLKPYMKARADLQLLNDEYQAKVTRLKDSYVSHLDAQSAVDAANAKFEFDGQYYSNRNGAAEAIVEWYQKEADGIVARMRGSIEKNLFDIYQANPNNERGFAAAYLSGARSMDWYEYLIAQELSAGLNRLESPVPSQSQPNLVDPSSAAAAGSDLWQNTIIRAGELLP